MHSFTVDRIGQDPGQRSRVPFAVALVDMADGPRLVGNMETPACDLVVDMVVRLKFEHTDGSVLIRFVPQAG